ncbi:uncharacterized protein LOC111634174 [Centruroides sculpturatus]|uniref:uncharacterized protein LOC111634174 n=1 Tax=Centruroides sculpturatus TaxID=218467 RepID=UPI000C6D4650|nr:uncharacterized protein LOC111634174 [Centruroides sculpturatus]
MCLAVFKFLVVKSEGNKYTLKPTNEEKRVYLVHLLGKVLMTGIPQIVTESNNKRRIFKLFVFVACLIGFLYQLGSFLSFYFTYPTSLEILVKYKSIKNLPKPMVTICNLNEVRRTMYCKDFPDNCERPKNIRNFCQHFNHFCQKENYNNEDLLFPLPHYYYYTSHNRTLIEKYGDEVEDMLNPYRNFSNRVILANDGIEIRKCYTVDLSKVYSNEFAKENYIHYSKRLVTESNIFVEMNVTFNPEETFYPTIPIGARLSVHSRTQLINPFINGVLIRPGRKYGIQLRIIEHNLLPAPYRTNCKMYDRSHGKTRHILYSRDRCLIECSKINWIKKCGCVGEEYPFRFEGKFCDDFDSLQCVRNLNNEDCYQKCRINCRYYIFRYSVDESPIECNNCTDVLKNPESVRKHGNRIKHSLLSFFLKSPEILIYKYKPQFQVIEVFGYIGGYVGIWLGISLIAVFDLLETLFVYFSYRLKGKIPKFSIKSFLGHVQYNRSFLDQFGIRLEDILPSHMQNIACMNAKEKFGCVSTEYPFLTNEHFCDATADFYSTNEINVTSCYNECQKEFSELFGYVGGYIGMWLGISLIAVCDFSEVICIYLYRITRERINYLNAK